jgi:hypothetical protein
VLLNEHRGQQIVMAFPGLTHLLLIAQTSFVIGLDGTQPRVLLEFIPASEGDGREVEFQCGLDHLEGVEAVLEATGLKLRHKVVGLVEGNGLATPRVSPRVSHRAPLSYLRMASRQDSMSSCLYSTPLTNESSARVHSSSRACGKEKLSFSAGSVKKQKPWN